MTGAFKRVTDHLTGRNPIMSANILTQLFTEANAHQQPTKRR